MTEICRLDSDDCLSLQSIYKAFRCGIKEEHSWALIYQSIVALKEYIKQNEGNYRFCEPNTLYIRSNGTIHYKSWQTSDNSSTDSDPSHVISFIAEEIFRALDYGTPDDEEIILPSDLEQIILLMTKDDAIDEGIEDNDNTEFQMVLNQIEEKSVTRVLQNLDVSDHYRNVCRALVAEAIEMTTFLSQISKGTQELKKIKNVTNEEVEEMHVELWAHLWMKVMRQLRTGVSLKRVDNSELINSKQREYELTPFEMLLDDINSKRYSLKKVSLPKHVEKDARTTILEFIRSRPPLKPAKERVLSPPRAVEPSLHQKLMEGIKSTHQLKPTPKPFERKFDSCHLPRGRRLTAFSIYTRGVVVDGSPVQQKTDTSPGEGVFQRFSFRSMSLRRTFSSLNISPPSLKSDGPPQSPPQASPLSTPTTSRFSFWRKLFNY